MKRNKNLFWGVVLSYINVLISILYGFVSVPVLLSALGKSEYGVYSTIASMIGYMSILDFGIHNVLVRYLTKYRVQKDRKAYENLLAIAFMIYSIIAMVLLGIGMALYNNIPQIFSDSFSSAEIQIAQKIYWVVLIDLVLSLPGAVFQCVINAEEHFIFGRATLGVKQILKLLLILLIANMGGRSFAFVLSVFGLNIVVIFVQAIYAFTVLHMRVYLHSWNWPYIGDLFRYTSYVFIASIAEQILWKLDSVILGMRIGAMTVAVYAVAMNLVTIYKKFSGAVSGIFLPKATAMSVTNSSPEASVRLMTKVGIMQVSILSLVQVGFILIGKEFIYVWLGQGYEEVYMIFLILTAALFIPSCQSIGVNILEARNKHGFRAIVMCGLAIINLVSTYIAVGRYEMIGAAGCTATAVVLGQVLILNFYYKKELNLNIGKFFKDTFLKMLLPVLASGIASACAIRFISLYGTWKDLILKAIIIGVIYTAVFLLFGGRYICYVYGVKNKYFFQGGRK